MASSTSQHDVVAIRRLLGLEVSRQLQADHRVHTGPEYLRASQQNWYQVGTTEPGVRLPNAGISRNYKG